MLRGKRVLIVRHRLLRLPIYLVLLVLSYVFLCDRAENLDSLPFGQTVRLVGFVREVFPSSGQERNTVYVLQGISGQAYLISQKNPPRQGTLLIVWGMKAESDTGRSVVIENGRVGDFLWKAVLFFTRLFSHLFGL